jgi:hypothetical protein
MTTTIEDKHLEKRFIVGTLALDSNLDLAAEARVLLDVTESVSDCAKLTKDFRTLFRERDSD